VKSYGQFCSIARALDLVGERWTLLVIRELLCGTVRFNDLRRGVPRISRTMLAARLRALCDAGLVTRARGEGPSYSLTEAGRELAGTIRELGTWGQRWLPRDLPPSELDSDALLWDIRRRVRRELLPEVPIVMRIELADERPRGGDRFLLLRRDEVSLCAHNPGFPEELHVRAPVQILTAWLARGHLAVARALRRNDDRRPPRVGARVPDLVRALPVRRGRPCLAAWLVRISYSGAPAPRPRVRS